MSKIKVATVKKGHSFFDFGQRVMLDNTEKEVQDTPFIRKSINSGALRLIGGDMPTTVDALKQRVLDLEAENEKLRKENAKNSTSKASKPSEAVHVSTESLSSATGAENAEKTQVETAEVVPVEEVKAKTVEQLDVTSEDLARLDRKQLKDFIVQNDLKIKVKQGWTDAQVQSAILDALKLRK